MATTHPLVLLVLNIGKLIELVVQVVGAHNRCDYKLPIDTIDTVVSHLPKSIHRYLLSLLCLHVVSV